MKFWKRSTIIADLASLALCVLLTAPRSASQSTGMSAELQSLLERMHQNILANGKLAEPYTSDELWHNLNFDKHGKKTVDESARYENMFVEGLRYRRKVESNGKPLKGKEAEEEQKRYDKAVAERREMTTDEKRHLMHTSFHSSLPSFWLDKLFDNRVTGHEVIDGRDALVVESTPRTDVHPTADIEKSALDWKETTWIDIADAMPARFVAELLKDRAHMDKGMTIRMEFQRIVDQPATDDRREQSVWLPRRSLSTFTGKMLWFNSTGTTEQTYTDFKKFRVDMRLLEDTMQEVPTKP
jgi:hypothetical protein